jgi:pimeloyl-ACP methyl ester carboxylesterase
MDLRDCIKAFGGRGEWAIAAERFPDYWNGPGAWRDMPPERRAAFAELLKPNFFEWDAVMSEEISAEQWAQKLPQETLLVCDRGTVRPIREIAAIRRRACPAWTYEEIDAGGHMAPLTHPEIVNPIVARFLDSRP